MQLWVVYADDHDYDAAGQWLVGVFSSVQKAEDAGKRAEREYWKANPGSKKRGLPNISIEPTTLDEYVV